VDVIARKGKGQIASLTSAERVGLMIVIVDMSAKRQLISPLIIFPRKNMNNQLMRGSPPGAVGVAHPSSWVQAHTFTQWLMHFLERSQPSENCPALLILYGHYSHTRNMEVIEMARANHVIIVSLPPHSTHKLQPMDKTFIGPLKTYCSEEIRTWIRHNNRDLSPFDIMELFGKTYLKVQIG
jgi:hypothetical protein